MPPSSSTDTDSMASEADQLPNAMAPEAAGRAVFGHETLIRTILRQFEQGRLPGVLLLHGPRGIGKATTAFHLARQIIGTGDLQTPEQLELQVARKVHPNLGVLRRTPRERGTGFNQNIRVDEIRRLLAGLQQTRGRKGHRIIIVDSVDDCNANAANALLKTLETPPARTLFILISHRPGSLLPTIRSRCQAHPMRPLSRDLVARVLQHSSIGDLPEDENVSMALDFANGRPRRAFRSLAMNDMKILRRMQEWLLNPLEGGIGTMMEISETLASRNKRTEAELARELVLDWITCQARSASKMPASKMPADSTSAGIANHDSRVLASALELWEKANLLFEDCDTYNLDQRQAFMVLFDHIFSHAQLAVAHPFQGP